MKVIKFNLNDFDMNIVREAARVLRGGGCVVYPTDTAYALGVDAFNAAGIERLFKIKKRPKIKPIPIMVRDIETAKRIAYIDKKTEKILEGIWPGAVTAILNKREVIPNIAVAGKKTVGLRIPAHSFARFLADNFKNPITATSASIFGEPPSTYSRDVMKIFGQSYPRPNLFLDAGDLQDIQPSTVLDLTAFQPKITHIGPISKKDLMGILK